MTKVRDSEVARPVHGVDGQPRHSVSPTKHKWWCTAFVLRTRLGSIPPAGFVLHTTVRFLCVKRVKTCTVCREPKSLDDFHRSPKSKDGRQTACKPCKKIIDAASYQKHRTARLAKRAIDRSIARKWLASLKDNRPCSDCRVPHRHWRLDWDHLPGCEKLFEIADQSGKAIGERGRQLILDEIAKCELVCANCHRDRTYSRRT